MKYIETKDLGECCYLHARGIYPISAEVRFNQHKKEEIWFNYEPAADVFLSQWRSESTPEIRRLKNWQDTIKQFKNEYLYKAKPKR